MSACKNRYAWLQMQSSPTRASRKDGNLHGLTPRSCTVPSEHEDRPFTPPPARLLEVATRTLLLVHGFPEMKNRNGTQPAAGSTEGGGGGEEGGRAAGRRGLRALSSQQGWMQPAAQGPREPSAAAPLRLHSKAPTVVQTAAVK